MRVLRLQTKEEKSVQPVDELFNLVSQRTHSRLSRFPLPRCKKHCRWHNELLHSIPVVVAAAAGSCNYCHSECFDGTVVVAAAVGELELLVIELQFELVDVEAAAVERLWQLVV